MPQQEFRVTRNGAPRERWMNDSLLALISLVLPVDLSTQAAGIFAARPDVANGQSAQTAERKPALFAANINKYCSPIYSPVQIPVKILRLCESEQLCNHFV